MAVSGIVVAAAGSGQEVAFDKFGDASPPTTDQRVQWVAFAVGTTGALAPATAANPVPTREGIVETVQVTLTTDTSAYASGDLIADAQAIAGAVRVSGGTCELVSLTVHDSDAQGLAFDVYVTSASTTWGSENSAPSAADSVFDSIQAIVPVATADYKTLNGAKVAQIKNIGAICKAVGSTSLYVAVVSNGTTPTYTASGVKLTFGFKQN